MRGRERKKERKKEGERKEEGRKEGRKNKWAQEKVGWYRLPTTYITKWTLMEYRDFLKIKDSNVYSTCL